MVELEQLRAELGELPFDELERRLYDVMTGEKPDAITDLVRLRSSTALTRPSWRPTRRARRSSTTDCATSAGDFGSSGG